MGLETGSFISDLVVTNPLSSDAKSQGDDHLRLLKSTIKTTFPNITGAMTATHTQLNTVPNLAPIASPTFTGVPAAPTAALGTSTTQLATTAFVQAAALAASGVPDQAGNGGKFLTTDGSSASWANTGLTLIATLTPTAAANLDFLTTFSSTYDNYLIIGQGIKPAADDSLRMRFAVAGVVDTGSNYFSAGDGASGSAQDFLSMVGATVLASGVGCGFTEQIQNVNDATNVKTGSVQSMSQFTGTPTFQGACRGHAYNAANAISGFRLYWSSGSNFVATGRIYVYGYSKT